MAALGRGRSGLEDDIVSVLRSLFGGLLAPTACACFAVVLQAESQMARPERGGGGGWAGGLSCWGNLGCQQNHGQLCVFSAEFVSSGELGFALFVTRDTPAAPWGPGGQGGVGDTRSCA